MREFNINGLCVPNDHYMVDLSQRVHEIDEILVAKGKYFTINRARQYGKTTTLGIMERYLRDRYIIISISFEGFDSSIFEDTSSFINAFKFACETQLKRYTVNQPLIEDWIASPDADNMQTLSARITKLVNGCDRPVILMVDEVDKSSDNQLFLNFIGMLRDKYLTRSKYGDDEHAATFKSVILAGVYDIKNLKLKIRPEEKHTYNSPWNIAAPFDLDMSFSVDEIAGMLNEYETDHGTGMDIQSIANEIRRQTNGYPFLVSLICKTIDEQLNREWTISSIDTAVYKIIKKTNILFDDIIKNIENREDFRNLIERILVKGESVPFVHSDMVIDLGVTFGILCEIGGKVSISNQIFERYIYEHLVSRLRTRNQLPMDTMEPSFYIHNGHLDIEMVLQRFSAFLHAERRARDSAFIEQNARLVFLAFVYTIINGTGKYHVESETRNNTRMDVIIDYLRDEFIIELKIWRGTTLEQEAYDQLTGYLDAKGKQKGYLLVFCSNKVKQPERGKWIDHNGYKIYEVIVPFLEEA
ncbi:hypothetical protein AGMMS49992_27690 [Clostridia bacterium]|nr:hypothetical protein AGMMS49992_27690 [Clostridia bacterium]